MRINILLLIAFLAAVFSCNNKPDRVVITRPPTKMLTYSVIQTFPHDTSSFTEGLLVYNGALYEGTGLNGKSKLMKLDLATGKPLQSVSLDKKYFGEGISIVRDTVYQLTWQEKVAFVYTLKDFKKIKEIPMKPDGWGMTTDGNQLIASDGTGTLYFYEPGTLKLLKTQDVTEGGSATTALNELEYIDGFIYANQYQENNIFKINPNSGEIVAKIDLSDLVNQVHAANPQADVMNGIAFDRDTRKIYITGKNWPQIYQVQFSE